jgi:hypothetical protein
MALLRVMNSLIVVRTSISCCPSRLHLPSVRMIKVNLLGLLRFASFSALSMYSSKMRFRAPGMFVAVVIRLFVFGLDRSIAPSNSRLPKNRFFLFLLCDTSTSPSVNVRSNPSSSYGSILRANTLSKKVASSQNSAMVGPLSMRNFCLLLVLHVRLR